MKRYFLLLFFLNMSINSSVYFDARINFNKNSYGEILIARNVAINKVINIKEEPFSIDVKYKQINSQKNNKRKSNNKNGILILNIQLNQQKNKEKQQILIPLTCNEKPYYQDDNMHIVCVAYPVLNS